MTWGTLLLQASDATPLIPLGVGGGIAALVIGMWRQDRKESQDRYASLAKESNERASAIAAEFRQIVQDNTKALTVLSESITSDNATTLKLLLAALRTGRSVNIEPDLSREK